MAGRICIVVGHGKSERGGYDSGAVGFGYHEFKIAREIAKFAQAELKSAYGAQCDLMNYEGNLYLQERINKLKTDYYDFIAEIHLNAGGGTGTEVYYCHTDETGKKYAEAIAESISARFGIRNRGAKIKLNSSGKDYFGIIRATKPTAVLVETVFIDTETDFEKVKTESGQKACGQAIADAIARVRGLTAESAGAASEDAAAPEVPTEADSVDVEYQAYCGKSWLPWVENYNEKNSDGYAGVTGKAITALRAGLSKGKIKYRAHTKGGKWYAWILDYNTKNTNGYAGVLGKEIDMLQMTLEGLPGYAVEYRVATVGGGFLPWVRDYNTKNSDGYAGITGKPFDRMQIRIVKI